MTFYQQLSPMLEIVKVWKNGFGMKNSTTLPSLANKFFNSLIDENDEPIYTYNDEYMQNFVRQSIKGGRCVVLNQRYISSVSDKSFDNISEELNVNGNVYEIRDKSFEYTNKHRKTIAEKYDLQFKEYRDINQEE